MIKQELLRKHLGTNYSKIGSVDYHRHNHEFYSNGDRTIAIKEFEEEKSFQKEVFFYRLFEEEKILRTPRVYEASKPFLLTEFIESDDKINLEDALRNWGKVHSYFLRRGVSELRIEEINNKNLPEFVLSHPGLFGEKYKQLAERVKERIRHDLQTLIHGDLYKANILTRMGNNYYIDFEFSGKGHPARDLALILLNEYDQEKVLSIYKMNIDFDYPELKEDVITYALMRGIDLIANLKNTDFDMDKKKKIHSKFVNSMNRLIQ